MDAKLVVVGGKANKAEVALKLPTVIGRGRDAGLTVAHATVSRHHCMIFERDGALVVRDNGSLNGTVVEGQRVTEALLKPGDKLTVGPLTFRADYEHSGSFPSLGEQPTVPNLQDTVGDIAIDDSAGRNGAPMAFAETDEPPTLSAGEMAANFDFLRKPPEVESEAAPDVEEAAPDVEQDARHGDETAGQDGDELAGLDVSAAPSEHAAADAEAPDEAGLDFLAEEVKPPASAHAPTFSFLNSAPVEPGEASAPEEEFAPPEAEPIAAEDLPEAAAAAEEAAAESTFSEEAPAATSDSDEMAGLDFLHDEGPAEGAAKDDAPSFGFLGALESTATPDDADSQPLDITLHDPEGEGEEVAAVDSDSPIASIDQAELNFDAESRAAADEDSGEFALPVEPTAASDDDRGILKFIDAAPADEEAQADEAADEDSGEYAISLEPHAASPLGPPAAEEEAVDNDAGFNFLDDAAPAANAEDDRANDDRPNDEDDAAAALPAPAEADEEAAA
ncbi:MAG TPA: FHA domain-containing protein, partial [Pirellulales bacterium]|nr:FHA domain-containing protein [Pirellulales bacterium]